MILVDTNVIVALANGRDDLHGVAVELVAGLPTEVLLVPPTVVAEVCYLLGERVSPRSEAQFLRSFAAGELQLAELWPVDLVRMAELTEQYADLGLGGTDASVVAIAERLGIERVATFDRRHFGVVRPDHVTAFTLLPD
ncbi:PIN domain-containing protein [Modestobacter sp. I12A-02628]|uniref:Ribonuclease VapC n=1 Tax=Goekera deserti TaxID=2497753 RepID=A0A7K3WCJ6_9ACTN|nr:PIN domain-containing protein [Goekera deserti]MPQ98468.1 PIN domain-containing protein [Goekera deserti]NDI48297.1 PIN domain-containing protein [Goekera deserti]NEL54046.1 PIN domain-containing protein [Goekera deserti]